MRRFHLLRSVDVSGVSGVGWVAEGVQFHDGQIAMKWRTKGYSLNVYDSIKVLLEVHGHNGFSRVEWLDDEGEIST